MAAEGRRGEISTIGATPPVPYTHAIHARRCREAADVGQVLSGQFLQVKSGPVVYCGRILAAWDHEGAGEMWKLELQFPVRGIQSFPAKRARQCGGVDGRCVCEHDAQADGMTRAAQRKEATTLREAAGGMTAARQEMPAGQVTC